MSGTISEAGGSPAEAGLRTGVVTAARAVTPRVRRITLAGPDVAGFATAPGALGPYLKFIVPTAGPDTLWPSPGPGGRLVWPASPKAAALRTYSIRRFDRAALTMDVDVVLHGDEGAGSRWAYAAAPGDVIGLGGPGHIPAPACGAYLLAGDHTALPAIAHILEHLPAGVAVRAAIEIPSPDEEQALETDADLDLAWLHRPPGRASRLPAAFDAFARSSPSDVLVWAGAEAAIARSMRGRARRGMGLPAERVQVLNYWKAGLPEGGFSYME